MTLLSEVPTLDLRRFDTDRDAFVRDVGEANRQFGFCCFSSHGIPESLIALAYGDFRKFFALPDPVKRRYHIPGIGGARGYTPFKVETAKDLKIADLKEFWHIGYEHGDEPANVWPDEVPEFKGHAAALMEAMDLAAHRILSVMALDLGLPDDWFRDKVEGGATVLRALHYPPVRPEDLPAVRAGAHEDIDLITLLVGATDSGLEIRTRDGEWLPVRASENTLIVNVGDMLQRLTNHVYVSTTHRVVNPADPEKSGSRYSMPYFVHPRPDFVIEPLAQCITEDHPDRGEPAITAGEFLDQRLAEIKLK